MTTNIFFEIHQDLPREGPGRNKYTRKAFKMLPKVDNPHILDIGCGPGGQTLELARLSQGDVIGIDTHQPYLDGLANRIKEKGLSDHVQAINRSMFDMNFPIVKIEELSWGCGPIFLNGILDRKCHKKNTKSIMKSKG